MFVLTETAYNALLLRNKCLNFTVFIVLMGVTQVFIYMCLQKQSALLSIIHEVNSVASPLHNYPDILNINHMRDVITKHYVKACVILSCSTTSKRFADKLYKH